MNCSGKLLSIYHHLQRKLPNHRFDLTDKNTLVAENPNNANDKYVFHTYEVNNFFMGPERMFRMIMIFPDGTSKVIKFDASFNYIGDLNDG